jgi:hypothetical protein
MLQVFNSRCQNCLFEQDRIVSSERAKEIISECIDQNTHFICHLSTMNDNGNVCCRGFYDTCGDQIQKIQIAKRLDLIEFVELPESKKFPPFRLLT